VYQPLIETDGRVTGILVHGVDVTDQVRARQEIDELYQRVRQANDAKTQFLANMSHELRTPLNAILGYVDLLALGVRGALSDGQLVDIERIRSASRYLLSLINDVLSFARVEAGQVAFQLQPVDVRVLFARANELVAQRATDKGITLDIIAPSDAVSIRADAERAQQILLNLLTNAVKFSDRGGCVTLSCTSDANAVRIHVRDTGRGIPADQRERIFEPFVQLAPRVPANARELPAGVGLGLAISRDYARKMDGELTVVSEDGVGSEFTLTLPRASTASARAGSE
jgi:signal transduction histidine kinase